MILKISPNICRKETYDSGDLRLPTERKTDSGQQQLQQQQQQTCNEGLLVSDYECVKCLGKFPTEAFLIQHLVADQRKCPICCKLFRYISNRVNHERVHTGEKPFTCEICKRGFAQEGNLRTHMRTHTGNTPYTCDICNRKFSQIGNLTTHKLTHTDSKRFACDMCDKKYCQKYQLIRHQKKQHS